MALGTSALDTAEELLQELAPETGRLWQGRYSATEDDDSGWIFRGQADATWDLCPSAHRRSGRDPWADYYLGAGRNFPSISEVRSAADLADLELELVLRFAHEVSRKGLEVPYDSPNLRDEEVAPEVDAANFPPRPHLGMFALAQHYGVPTRLLDWTTNPLVAAYFACKDIAKRTTRPERFCVWALSRRLLHHHLAGPATPVKARIVTVPTVNNPKLHAQAGLFTLVYGPPDRANLCQPTLDSLASDTQAKHPFLWQFSVPSSNARTLLRFLALKGVSASSVDPGHEGAAEFLRERRWHQRAPQDHS